MLKDSQDAYGHKQYGFYKGRQVVEIVERDDGLIDPSETTRSTIYLSTRTGLSERDKLHDT